MECPSVPNYKIELNIRSCPIETMGTNEFLENGNRKVPAHLVKERTKLTILASRGNQFD